MIRPTQDNVLIVLDPDVPEQTAAGVFTVNITPKGKAAYGNRIGTVLAVGPGHYEARRAGGMLSDGKTPREVQTSRFIPTSVKPGERVVVHTTAGDSYTYTKRQDFAEMFGLVGDNHELRMVREEEILAVFEAEEGVAAE